MSSANTAHEQMLCVLLAVYMPRTTKPKKKKNPIYFQTERKKLTLSKMSVDQTWLGPSGHEEQKVPKAAWVLAVREPHACLCGSAGAQVGEAKGISKGGTSEARRQCFSICFQKPTCLCISTTLCLQETNAVGL